MFDRDHHAKPANHNSKGNDRRDINQGVHSYNLPAAEHCTQMSSFTIARMDPTDRKDKDDFQKHTDATSDTQWCLEVIQRQMHFLKGARYNARCFLWNQDQHLAW